MNICKDCFLDEELRSEINANAVIDGICDVCGKEGKLMDFSEFHGFFVELLSLFSPTNNKNDRTIVHTIQDEWHLFKDQDVAKSVLADVITTSNLGYSIADFVNYTDEICDRIAVWDRLKTSVKEKSRFFTNMDEFALYNYLTAGKSLHVGQKLYRSRITPIGQKKIKCDKMG